MNEKKAEIFPYVKNNVPSKIMYETLTTNGEITLF